MAAYVFVHIDVHDPDRYRDYVQMSPVSIAKYGGRFIARAGRAEALEGPTPARRVVILEFPTYEQATAWHASPEYAEAKALRQATSTATMIVVEGVGAQS